MKKLVLNLSFFLGLILVACQTTEPATQTAAEMMQGNSDYGAFSRALENLDMQDLGSSGELTLFVPTTEAFEAYAAAKNLSLEDLLNSPDLEKILTYHMADGLLTAAEIMALTEITSRTGETIKVDVMDESVILNKSAKVIVADLKAQNVVIHVIDAVLEPAVPLVNIVDLAASNDDLSILVAALKAAGLLETLSSEGPFTVFAPTNKAFETALAALGLTAEELLADKDLLTTVLTYHVLLGEFFAADVLAQETLKTVQGEEISVDAANLKLNDSGILETDIKALNGVVHIIDAVLLPPSLTRLPSIVDTVVSNPDFSILLAAVQKAGLVDALSAKGPLTVFAPNNKAFEDLAHNLHVELADLLELANLKDILLYHVVSGALDAETIAKHDAIKTLQGSNIHVTVSDGAVFLNQSKVIAADINVSNGIIHVIDTVLLPN